MYMYVYTVYVCFMCGSTYCAYIQFVAEQLGIYIHGTDEGQLTQNSSLLFS